jgi:hypothetical protein
LLDQRRNQSSFYHEPNPAAPLQHHYKSGRSMTAERGWQRPFDDPITLPRGRKLVTLRDAAEYITKLPKAEDDAPEWQAAMEALLLVAELGGPTMFARIRIMLALNRHIERVFNPDRKEPHWGRRKLARIGEALRRL